MSDYSLYILHCADDSYYTGIARDVDARLEEHRGGAKGAKYLRGRAPFELVYRCDAGDRSAAQSLEYRVKALDRDAKQALVDGRLSVSELQASGSDSAPA